MGGADVLRESRSPVSADAIAATLVFSVGLAARLLAVFVFPGINHPDEIFQTVEQAHSLVFGTGLVPWEFVYGTRSWVLPGALAGLMVVASWLGDGPDYYMTIIGVTLAALGASSALCAFLWGRRFFGTAGGIIAGTLTAVWIDAVYFGPRALSDTVAAHLLVIALYASTPDGQRIIRRRRAITAGALLIPRRLGACSTAPSDSGHRNMAVIDHIPAPTPGIPRQWPPDRPALWRN